jgi:hypothetical protein
MSKTSIFAASAFAIAIASLVSPASADQRAVDLRPSFTGAPDNMSPRAAPGGVSGYAAPLGLNGGQAGALDFAQRQHEHRRLCGRQSRRRLSDRRRLRLPLLK